MMRMEAELDLRCVHTWMKMEDELDIYRKTMIAPKMHCGSFYIPKKKNPLKPLGEDSHFVSEPAQTVGVADGVGGWAKKGIDAGAYARQLMRNSAAAVHLDYRAGNPIDPISVLRVAYASTAAKGSSTACIATLDGDRLRVANVGDSGLWIFRENRCAFISPTQQHEFNCPYQLGNSMGCDRPGAAAVMEYIVEHGDVLVVGTDGLLDNVYPSEVEMLLETMDEDGTEVEAKELARRIAEMALGNSVDRGFCSPFQMNAEAAGRGGITGGKTDDITVVVALIY